MRERRRVIEDSFWKGFADNDFLCFLGTDNEGRITFVNRAGRKMYRYSSRELIGEKIGMLYRGIKLDPSLDKLLRQKSRSGKPWQAEIWNVRKDGEKFPIWIATQYLFDKNGNRTGALSIARDITEDVRAREEAQRLAGLTRQTNLALISTDREGKIDSVNRAAEKIYGWRAEELIGRNVRILYSQKDPKSMIDFLRERRTRGEGWEAEVLRKDKKGRVFPVWLATSYVKDLRGNVIGSVGISRDITGEKQSQEQFEYMAELVDRAHFCIVSTDNDHRIRSINRAGEEMFGYRAEELIGKDREILYRGVTLSVKKFMRLQRKMLRGEGWVEEVYGVRKNDEIFPLRIATAYLYDDRGRRTGSVGIIQDITREQEDRKKVEYTAELVERGSYCILATGSDNKITSINPAGEKMYGYKKSELIGRDRKILYQGVKLAGEKKEELKRKMEEGEGWVSELYNVKKNGEIFPVRVATAYLYDEDGKKKGAVSITQDITEEERLKNELLESTKLAYLGRMAAGVAHEMKNPLSAIKNCAYLFSDDETLLKDPAKRRLFRVLRKEIDRLNRMTLDLLDFGRPQPLRREPADINRIIKDTIKVFKHHDEYREGISFRSYLKPVGKVSVDVNRIKQVLGNLVLNAVQALKGSGTVSIYSSRKGKYVMLTVRDNGPGISTDIQEQMFEPFFTTKSKGSGLGMSIVKTIVDQHQGRIEVTSRPGQGATFKVFLPVSAGSRPRSRRKITASRS